MMLKKCTRRESIIFFDFQQDPIKIKQFNNMTIAQLLTQKQIGVVTLIYQIHVLL